MRMLNESRLDPNYQFGDNRQPAKPHSLLDIAIDRQATELAIWLTRNGADINRKRTGWTPLMCACARSDAKIIDALIAAGAKIDTRASRDDEGNSGATALMIAADRGNFQAVDRLLDAGANPGLRTPKGQTAAHFALSTKKEDANRLKVLRELVRAGCPLCGNELHRPVYERNWRYVEALLKLGCPVNERLRHNVDHGPRKGETPLTLAVRNDGPDWLSMGGAGFTNTMRVRLQIVEALLAAGADPNLPDAKGRVPLMVVDAEGEPQIANLLLDAGADPSLVDKKIVAKRDERKKKNARLLSGANEKNKREFLALWNAN